jgi:2-polyprenyl-3-methyl-5-hydroxy-6-metoxy-1,4-benzoquinol methylase
MKTVSPPTPEDPTPDGARTYVLRRSEEELRRLTLQDELLRDSTVALFGRAGIAEGMRVLDVGSGAGDVALTLARMVGPTGAVVGVELDPPSGDVARRRAADAGTTNLEFLVGDVAAVELPGPFDAVVGRLVLMHIQDPAAVLARLRGTLRPGGLVVFQEPHLAGPWLSFPISPTLEHVQRVRERALAKSLAVYSLMGLALRGTFLEAGLPDPDLTADAMVGGGPGWAGYRYIEQTVRGLLPMWTRVGAEGVEEVKVDGMAARIEAEVGETGSMLIHTLVGAWAANPGATG